VIGHPFRIPHLAFRISLILLVLAAVPEASAMEAGDAALQESLQRYNAGVAALQRRELEYAVYQFRQSIRLNPLRTEAYHNLGIALLQLRQPRAAKEAFTRALELEPDHPEAHLGRGLAHRDLGEFFQAIEELTRALPRKADDPQLRVMLGALYRQTRQPELAAVQFREALRLVPTDADARFQLGLALADANQVDEAIAVFREASRERPQDGETAYQLGATLGEKIRLLVDEKVAAFQRAVELPSSSPDAHYRLAVAYIQKAQFSRIEEKRELLRLALEQYRLFQQAAPTDPKAADAAHNIEVLEPQVK
jgi:tetratricopeptide (TPR) repeat protein